MADIRDGLGRMPVARDFSILLGGDYEEQQKAFRELLTSFLLALVLVYMVLASLYESLKYPFVVMFSVPLAVIGVVLMLLLTGTSFNVQSYIGCIMLGGIVVNNAHLVGGPYQPVAPAGKHAPAGGGGGSLRPPPAPDFDDRRYHHAGHGAPGPGPGGRRRGTGPHGAGRYRRSAQFQRYHAFGGAGDLLVFRRPEIPAGGRRHAPWAGAGTGQGQDEMKNRPWTIFIRVILLTVILLAPATGFAEGRPAVDVSLPAGEVPADGALRLTLNDAVLMALENNRSLVVERLQPEIQQTYEGEEQALFDPVLTGEAAMESSESQRLARSGSDTESSTSDVYEAGIALEKFFSSGTRVEAGATTRGTDSSLYMEKIFRHTPGSHCHPVPAQGVRTGDELGSPAPGQT